VPSVALNATSSTINRKKRSNTGPGAMLSRIPGPLEVGPPAGIRFGAELSFVSV
jgi:hypothetical protein